MGSDRLGTLRTACVFTVALVICERIYLTSDLNIGGLIEIYSVDRDGPLASKLPKGNALQMWELAR